MTRLTGVLQTNNGHAIQVNGKDFGHVQIRHTVLQDDRKTMQHQWHNYSVKQVCPAVLCTAPAHLRDRVWRNSSTSTRPLSTRELLACPIPRLCLPVAPHRALLALLAPPRLTVLQNQRQEVRARDAHRAPA